MDASYRIARLRQTLTTTISAYVRVEIDYKTLPFLVRRDVAAHNGVERFYCAAILQHRPSETALKSGPPTPQHSHLKDDTCPKWLYWFADILRAWELIAYLESVGYTPAAEPWLQGIDGLLLRAANKLYRVETAVKNMRINQAVTRTASEINNTWIEVCTAVKNGSLVRDAVLSAQQEAFKEHDYATQQPQEERRFGDITYFEFTQSYQDAERGFTNAGHSSADPTLEDWFTKYKAGHRPTMPHPTTQYTAQATASSAQPTTTTAAPTRSARDLLLEYNRIWDNLTPIEALVPLPSADFSTTALKNRQTIEAIHYPGCTLGWSEELIMKMNAQIFFLQAFDFRPSINVQRLQYVVAFQGGNNENEEALLKQLKRKENLRWHPDKMNRRTNSDVIDDSRGKDPVVVAVRSAVQELTGQLEQ